jgi:hypothetical protein
MPSAPAKLRAASIESFAERAPARRRVIAWGSRTMREPILQWAILTGRLVGPPALFSGISRFVVRFSHAKHAGDYRQFQRGRWFECRCARCPFRSAVCIASKVRRSGQPMSRHSLRVFMDQKTQAPTQIAGGIMPLVSQVRQVRSPTEHQAAASRPRIRPGGNRRRRGLRSRCVVVGMAKAAGCDPQSNAGAGGERAVVLAQTGEVVPGSGRQPRGNMEGGVALIPADHSGNWPIRKPPIPE